MSSDASNLDFPLRAAAPAPAPLRPAATALPRRTPAWLPRSISTDRVPIPGVAPMTRAPIILEGLCC